MPLSTPQVLLDYQQRYPLSSTQMTLANNTIIKPGIMIPHGHDLLPVD
jgi:hypothetical protein